MLMIGFDSSAPVISMLIDSSTEPQFAGTGDIRFFKLGMVMRMRISGRLNRFPLPEPFVVIKVQPPGSRH